MIRLLWTILTTLLAYPAASQDLPFLIDDKVYREETNDVWINGNVWNYWPKTLDKYEDRNAMVCGFKNKGSYLSVRAAPNSASKEIFRAPKFTVFSLSGEVSENLQWAKVYQYEISVDSNGLNLPATQEIQGKIQGWVSTRYLCDFVH